MVLAAIAVTKVVLSGTPLPVVVKTFGNAIPVAVRGSDPWAIAAGVASICAVFAATAALIVAIITLKKIGEQIELGRKELKAVTDDLEISRGFQADTARKPILNLCFQGGSDRYTLSKKRALENMVELPLYVQNSGTRSSKDCRVTVLVPTAILGAQAPTTSFVGGIEYGAYVCQINHPIYSRDVRVNVGLERLRLTHLEVPVELLFSINDDYGRYPEDNNGPNQEAVYSRLTLCEV